MYKEIRFSEADHKYSDHNNIPYISVTQLIEKYKKKYDREFWCMYTALKEKNLKVKPFPDTREISISGVKNTINSLKKDSIFIHYYNAIDARWKGLNAEACFRGNKRHDYLEESINKSKKDYQGETNTHIKPKGFNKPISTIHDLNQTDLSETLPSVYKRLSMYIKRGCSIYAEKRVHLPKYKIAGTIDVPIIKGKKFCILDWKTNKDEIRKESGYYKKQKIGKEWVKTNIWVHTKDLMSYPINYVESSKFYEYAIQLSLYAYIMEEWGYELVDKGLEIIHMRPGYKPKLIKIPYMKTEVELMLNHYALAA